MSNDRTSPSGGAKNPQDAGKSASSEKPATKAEPKVSGDAKETSTTPAPKPATSTKPATAAPAKPVAAAPTKPAPTKPAPTKPVAAPAPKTGTAPQPVVSGAKGEQFRAQPKNFTAGPPTEAFDPIADERQTAGAAVAPVAPARPMGPRRARLLVSRLDPWSVMKTAFMLAVSLAIVMLVATAVLWYALDATGVFVAIGKVVNDLAGSGSTNFNFAALVGFSRVMGVALIIAALEIVLTSALSTLFAFLYNLSVGLTGGVEVTLSEES